jgi:hypothetical protein
VTACLIVQDEEERLPAALESVAFCDEIVVVDGGSSDRTVELARAAGARVLESPWPGYARQRNVAIDAARGDWILEVDADERVSPRLRHSIEALLAGQPAGPDIAVCALRNRFLGGMLGPSAKYPAYRARLFRRGSYRHDQSRAVHEGLDRAERPAILDGDLEHELAGTLREALSDMWGYARLDSQHVQRPSDPSAYLLGIAVRPLAKVTYRTVVDGGWRDGWRGLLKIWLDAVSDALVWTRVLLGARQRPAVTVEASSHQGSHSHFGRRTPAQPKVVVLAARGESARMARRWLEQLQAKGLDVALVSDERSTATNMPVQTVQRFRPMAVMRALDLEMQIQAIHAVVPFGRRARLLSHLLPGSLRPSVDGLSADLDADSALDAIRASIAS